MFSKSYCAVIQGMSASMIQVEADVSDGMPMFHLVGYLSSEVKEAKERVRIAIKNSGFKIPSKKITVNLSPADLRKDGTSFDLAIAVAILESIGVIKKGSLQNWMFIGELSLNGNVRPVSGILPIVYEAKKQGILSCMVPEGNKEEGAVVDGIKVFGVSNLKDAVCHLNGEKELARVQISPDTLLHSEKNVELDFSEVAGQELLKRAIEIAVSGLHNILMVGPPGTGKTMLARCIPSIMPELTFEEAMEISKIFSISGLLNSKFSFVSNRPFRAPHHTITTSALVGGGAIPKPGEISFANGGVLFLDELPEFKRNVIEALRQPLEDREIMLARRNTMYRYPSFFMLVAAMNPCPCGYYPDKNRCKCTEKQIQAYLRKISHPLLERIDICAEADPIEYTKLRKNTTENSESIRRRVKNARKRQLMRYQGTSITFNSELTPKQIKRYIKLDEEEEQFLKQLFDKMKISARGYHRILRVSRTIADLADSNEVKLEHLHEAVFYRGFDTVLWKG